jgi:signal peptidase
MGKSIKGATKKRRIKRTFVIKAFGALVIALFVVAPSLLHYYAGIGVNPILTGSMRPYIQPGDVLITKLTPITDVKVGDIIALVSQETGVFYTHRVVEIRDQSGLLRLVTKGDANGAADLAPYLASPSDEVPRSIGRIIWIGYPLVYLTSIQGRQASLSLIITANIIALFLFLFREKIKEAGDKAYQIYKDLYAETQLGKAQKEREARVYRELFEEERAAQDERGVRANVYKDLFGQSQEEKEINEAEMAALITEMKNTNIKKEKNNEKLS